MFSATLALYRDAAKLTGRALSRSMMVWLLPVIILVVLQLAGMLLSGLSLIGGLILFVLQSYLYGAYLHLVSEALTSRRPLRLTDIKDALGQNMREVMNLLFIYWILQMALSFAVDNGQISASISFVIVIAATVLFNPGPEIIHQERSGGGMEIVVKAFRWMSANGPEWVPNLVLTAGVLYGLNMLGGLLLSLLGIGLLLHPWMLFRGALFVGIGSSSRRSRAWRSKF
jgi:hypothetical protein